VRLNGRKLDPWGKRRHPNRYSPDVLHAMLLDDYAHHRPLGGPGERGAAFTIGACAKVARARGVKPDDYFKVLLAEGAQVTGSTAVALA
jgi:prolyl-tRNA editing enzyme YbaK/EbsC (Cys-tRNA(Pro) deacylase)